MTVSDFPTQVGQFLSFGLLPETIGLLSVDQLTEVLQVPVAQVVPIPQMPVWTLGIYNWRGEILWLVDLGQFLGLAASPPTQQHGSVHYAVLLIHGQGGHRLGLVVARTEDIMVKSQAELQPLGGSLFPPTLTKLSRGYWRNAEGEALILLDGEAVLQSLLSHT
ncbi:chemotaxis protein CheW [Anthocerotibacter panamensis]|uniref:chemotaxis protein CheW n=1 Tax=Anthocerotibacter panamensis TaxID=2857077 RepID=UPI001C404473|nr:chemotaxis protein CheW [Anthocerotibacter panamensis]